MRLAGEDESAPAAPDGAGCVAAGPDPPAIDPRACRWRSAAQSDRQRAACRSTPRAFSTRRAGSRPFCSSLLAISRFAAQKATRRSRRLSCVAHSSSSGMMSTPAQVVARPRTPPPFRAQIAVEQAGHLARDATSACERRWSRARPGFRAQAHRAAGAERGGGETEPWSWLTPLA